MQLASSVLRMVMVEMRLFAGGPQCTSASGLGSWHQDFSVVLNKPRSRFRETLSQRSKWRVIELDAQ